MTAIVITPSNGKSSNSLGKNRANLLVATD
jgi:hypothetical protein